MQKRKQLFGPVRSSTGTLLDADNTSIQTDSKGILTSWKEHFSTLLSLDSTVAEDFLRNVPHHPKELWMNTRPSYHEFEDAMKRMKVRKSPGPENIPFELLQHGGRPLKARLFALILNIWEAHKVPKGPKMQSPSTYFRRQIERHVATIEEHRYFPSQEKIFARILLNRLQVIAEKVLPESQCGFRASRDITDMILCARQLQEKSREQRKPLFLLFYDLEKAFDSAPRAAL